MYCSPSRSQTCGDTDVCTSDYERTRKVVTDGRIASRVADKTLTQLILKLGFTYDVHVSLICVLTLHRTEDSIYAVVGLTEHDVSGLAR
jgi:flagellar motor switch protein FliM